MGKLPDPAIKKVANCPLIDRDPEAWIRCCTARFLPLARRIAGDDDLAHDALHTSWLIILQKIHTYRGGPPACAWVHSIVRHETMRAASVHSREEPLNRVPEATWGLPEVGAYAAELRQLLIAAIDDLPPTFREVVRMRDIEERSNAEVAERLHISKQNAAVRLHRAHRLLRARLQAHH